MIRVTCAIIENKNKVLCAQRSALMNLPLKWEFPGGKLEAGESEEDCLIREIREELNLIIGNLERLPANIHTYGEGKIIELIPFKCKLLESSLILKEHAEVQWLAKDELLSLDWAEADIPIVQYYKQHF
jgi:8-oxo-dGTP diphosphatase